MYWRGAVTAPRAKSAAKTKKKAKTEKKATSEKMQRTPTQRKKHATFKARTRLSKSNAADNEKCPVPHDMPQAALPTGQRGKSNYTVRSPNGAKIGVLLKKNAFFLLSSAGGVAPSMRPHISWSRGIEKAWVQACKCCGFK